MAGCDAGPAILNKTLQMSEFHNILIKNGLNVKVAKSTLPNTCIFPKISLAFLVKSLVIENSDCIDTQMRIQEFIEHHEKSFIILIIKQLDKETRRFVGNVQLQILSQKADIILSFSWTEAAEIMQNLSKMLHPQVTQSSQEKMESFFLKLNNDERVLMEIIKNNLGDKYSMLLETFGSIGDLANANQQQLFDLHLTKEESDKILNLFEINTF